MATLSSTVPTLLDVTRSMNPDGTQADIAEILHKTNEILMDATWKEGNLVTGDRTTVRTGLPSVGYRALNEGVARSKGTARQVDEAAALLEGNTMVDRKLAILSQNIAKYRLGESTAFMEAMNQQFASSLIYGNSTTSPKEFTGFMPRFNSLSGPTASQIIDGGGTGTDNRSILLVGWDTEKVSCIFPKGTIGGLQHMDTTSNLRPGPDGYPIGDEVLDASSNPYLAYKDHWEWNMGLSVKDPRYVVRIANIDASNLTRDASGSSALIQDLMVQAVETVQGTTPSMAFYMSRRVRAFLRRQLLNTKNAFLGYDLVAGERALVFDQVPIRRVDSMSVDEARVV